MLVGHSPEIHAGQCRREFRQEDRDTQWNAPDDWTNECRRTVVGVSPARETMPPLWNQHRESQTDARCPRHILVSELPADDNVRRETYFTSAD